jgi:hypothetical protein
LARTLVGSFLGLLEAIGFAFDGEDLGVVDQAIDQGDNAGGIWKDLAPFGKGPVGGEPSGLADLPLVAPARARMLAMTDDPNPVPLRQPVVLSPDLH